MHEDFHYYATYCAAQLAGYPHEESQDICYCAQLVDHCSKTFLGKIKGPATAATTQLQLELMDARTDILGLQDITRIWTAFHFLPADLNAPSKGGRRYRNKFRLICGPNGKLLARTVELAKGKGPQAVGIAMHVLADTWAHRYFAGTPSLVINNTNYYFFEILDGEERRITFRHNPSVPDDLDEGKYTNSVLQNTENNVMNLGHGRAGHLPDYSFVKYKYLPAWGGYEEIIKDNPSDYMHAFAQMVYALRWLREGEDAFRTDVYDGAHVAPYIHQIREILCRRQLDASAEWKALGEKLSGQEIEDFDLMKYQEEYRHAKKEEKDDTFLGRFIVAALAQKSMVTNRIYSSGSKLAGVSVDYRKKGFRGIKAFRKLIGAGKEEKV